MSRGLRVCVWERLLGTIEDCKPRGPCDVRWRGAGTTGTHLAERLVLDQPVVETFTSKFRRPPAAAILLLLLMPSVVEQLEVPEAVRG